MVNLRLAHEQARDMPGRNRRLYRGRTRRACPIHHGISWMRPLRHNIINVMQSHMEAVRG